MQSSKRIILCVVATLLFPTCGLLNKNQSFESAIEKEKNSLNSQVNDIHEGVPFFTVETLNPTWEPEGVTPIVKIPQNFKLLNQNKKEIDGEYFKNHLTVVSFAFTSCVGFCPTLVKNLVKVSDKLKDYSNTQYLVVSVDPEVDTPEVLKKYQKQMRLAPESKWTLLTGEKEKIFSFIKDTLVSQAFERPGEARKFTHSEHFYVFDGQARLRGIFNGTRLDTPTQIQKLAVNLAP